MYRKISGIILSVLIALAIFLYMLVPVWGELIERLKTADPVWLIPALIFCILSWWVRGFRYQHILSGLDIKITLAFSTACIVISQTVNLVVPARLGDLVRVFILKHEYNATISEGLSSLVVERVFDVVCIAVLGLVSLFYVLNVPAWFIEMITFTLVAGVIFFIFLIVIRKMSSENRYLKIILNLLNEVREASLSVRAIIILGVSSIIIWILETLACQMVVFMFNTTIPFMLILLGIVIANLVKAIPITPGGIGPYEFMLSTTFGLAGISPAAATLIAVTDHLIKNLVTAAGGIIGIYFFRDWIPELISSTISRKMEDGEDGNRQ